MGPCSRCKNRYNVSVCNRCYTIYLTDKPNMFEPKEVIPMIKVNRKPVDKQKEIIEAVNEYTSLKAIVGGSYPQITDIKPDVLLKERIDTIYGSEHRGEIETIEIGVIKENVIMYESADNCKVKLTLEQCKEIAKAIQ